MTSIKNWALRKYVALQSHDVEEEGQGLVEYGLIIALVAVVAIAGLRLLGGNVNTLLGGISFS